MLCHAGWQHPPRPQQQGLHEVEMTTTARSPARRSDSLHRREIADSSQLDGTSGTSFLGSGEWRAGGRTTMPAASSCLELGVRGLGCGSRVTSGEG